MLAKLDDSVNRFLSRIPKKHAAQIIRRIDALCDDPYPRESKLLRGFEYLRVHCGEYRIIYRIEDHMLIVCIVGKRNDDEVYRRLKRLLG